MLNLSLPSLLSLCLLYPPISLAAPIPSSDLAALAEQYFGPLSLYLDNLPAFLDPESLKPDLRELFYQVSDLAHRSQYLPRNPRSAVQNDDRYFRYTQNFVARSNSTAPQFTVLQDLLELMSKYKHTYGKDLDLAFYFELRNVTAADIPAFRPKRDTKTPASDHKIVL